MSEVTSGYHSQDGLGMGIDTVTLVGDSAGDGYQYTTSAPINESADAIDFNSASSTWGYGEGLNGDVIRPEDAASFIDVLDKVEFDASIYSTDPLNRSILNASINAFDQDGNYLFQRNFDSHADQMPNTGARIDDDRDEIYVSADTTDVYFNTEIVENKWETRDILRNIAESTNQSDPGSTFIFIRPESIRNEGTLRDYSHDHDQFNPEPRDFTSLSQTAPLSFELSNEVVTEIREYVNTRSFDVSSQQIAGFSTDAGPVSDIIINLSEYQDANGDIDFEALNNDNKFILEIDSNAGENVSYLDNVYAGVGLRSDSPDGGTINLHQRDHEYDDHNYDHDYDNPTLYVENAGTDQTIIELGFDQWGFHFLQNLENTENPPQFLTYHLDNINTTFSTINSHSNAYLYSEEINQLSNSIQTISLDLRGFDFSNPSGEDIEIMASPLNDFIDFSTVEGVTNFLNLDQNGADYLNLWANYQLVKEVSPDHHYNVGNIHIDAEIDENGHLYQQAYGWVNGDDLDDQAESILSDFRLSGNANNGQWGEVRYSISYDQINDSYNLDQIDGNGWGREYIDSNPNLASDNRINWEQFANLDFINLEAGIFDQYAEFEIDTYLDSGDSLELSYNLYQLSDYLSDGTLTGDNPLKQLAVLGDSVDQNSKFVLDINAESLRSGWNIESTDITINFDPTLFGNINASDIKIGGALPLANAVDIDNENGTIRLAAASLSDLAEGSGIYDLESLASISLDFNEEQIQHLSKNLDGSLMINPLTFDISVNENETIFSTQYEDEYGLTNREIVSLDELGGSTSVIGQEVTLYEAKINLEQQGDGLTLGTQRVIGSDASYTNLVRKGDTISTNATWLNVGNIEANNLTYSEIYNQNATLKSGSFSQTSLASGSFINGEFVQDARESTVFTADVEITGEAGSVVDMADGIVAIAADGTTEVFNNNDLGSSNLITYQGDLNYDGRVSMKDLAYLNAGAARQQLIDSSDENGNVIQVASEASYARDVDADFSGKIDLADLSVLDADWGKSLHNGDKDFQGSSEVSWDELDNQGETTSWDNDSFKDQNETESESDYVGSLESPTSNAIGADNNQSSGDGGIDGEAFQDPLAA